MLPRHVIYVFKSLDVDTTYVRYSLHIKKLIKNLHRIVQNDTGHE